MRPRIAGHRHKLQIYCTDATPLSQPINLDDPEQLYPPLD